MLYLIGKLKKNLFIFHDKGTRNTQYFKIFAALQVFVVKKVHVDGTK